MIQRFLSFFGVTLVRDLPRHSTRFAMKHFKGKRIKVVEVGTFEGKNAEDILDRLSVTKFFIVDPYESHADYSETEPGQTNKVLNKAMRKCGKRLSEYPHLITWLRKYSDDALDEIPMVDFIYIDGDHSYKQAKKDMVNYWDKVNEGGILAGHDITAQNYGVAQAFVEFCSERNLKPYITRTDWWVVKN